MDELSRAGTSMSYFRCVHCSLLSRHVPTRLLSHRRLVVPCDLKVASALRSRISLMAAAPRLPRRCRAPTHSLTPEMRPLTSLAPEMGSRLGLARLRQRVQCLLRPPSRVSSRLRAVHDRLRPYLRQVSPAHPRQYPVRRATFTKKTRLGMQAQTSWGWSTPMASPLIGPFRPQRKYSTHRVPARLPPLPTATPCFSSARFCRIATASSSRRRLQRWLRPRPRGAAVPGGRVS
jgi:hypothetical protein